MASQTSETPAVEKPNGNGRFRIILILVVLLLVGGGLAAYSYFGKYETTDDAQIDGHLNPISARISGNVLEVNVEENQQVEAGTVLVRIDPRDYQVAVAKAEADVADAIANARAQGADVPIMSTNTSSQLANTQAGAHDARTGLLVAEQQVSAAKARLAAAIAREKESEANQKKAASDLERFRALVKKDEISQQQFDSAVAAATSADAQVESTRASVTEAKESIQVAESGVTQARDRIAQADSTVQSAMTAPKQVDATQARADAAQAKVAVQRAVLDQAKLNLEYTVIKAQVGGVIGRKSVEVGQNVAPGQQLMAIVPFDDIWVTANFKETQLRKMKVGQRTEIEVDAYGRSLAGHVESISPASGSKFSLLPPENATGNYVKVVQRVPVRIRFERGEDPQHVLRPGMSVAPKVYVK